MAGFTPNVGEEVILKLITNKYSTTRDLVIGLFKSDTADNEANTKATYTEADFTGYSNATLTGASWTITPGAPTEATYAEQSFASTAGSQNQPIYGYYVWTTTDETLVCAERFTDGPYTIVNDGDTIKVTPKITLA